MQMVVRAFPVLPGREESLRNLAKEISSTRSEEAADFFRRMGVVRETWHVQETPAGTWVIDVTQIADGPVDPAADRYAASQHPFDRWLKDQIAVITGFRVDDSPLGPRTECILDAHQPGASPPAGRGA